MREQQIAQKVAQGDQGVTEAILQQTYQVSKKHGG